MRPKRFGAKRKMLDSLSKHKVKIGGGLLALAILASVVGWGQWWKSRAHKYKNDIVALEAKELKYQRELNEAKYRAMTAEKLASQTDSKLLAKGAPAPSKGFFRTQAQEARCLACIEAQEASDAIVEGALKAQADALLKEELAVGAKKKWKSRAIVGIPVALAGGILIDQLFIKKKNR